MTSSSIKKIIVVLLFVVIIGTPLFYLKWGVYPYTLAKALFFQGVVEVLFALWLALAIMDKKYRPRKSPLLIAVGIFLAVLTLAAVFGVDPARSFWSTYERAMGVVAIYHFAALALVISCLGREIPWKRLFYASLGTAMFIDLLAWLQLGNQNLLLIETPGNRPGATFGNPTFFSDYLIFNIFIGLYFLFDYWRDSRPANPGSGERKDKNVFLPIFFFASLAANLAALFLAQTRGDILGVGIGCIVMLFVFAFRPPELAFSLLRSRRFYAVVLAAVVIGGAGFWFTRTNDIWSHVPGLSRFKNLSLSLAAGDQDFQPRIIAFTAAWKGFLEKPFTGWGPENFDIVFNKFYDPKSLEFSYQETRFDKPHNFFMESLVSGGIPLTLAYFAVFGVIMYEASRIKDRLWIVAIPMVCAYIISELFVFETIGGMLMLYITIGFIDGEYGAAARVIEEKKPKQYNERKSGLAFAFLAAGVLCAYFVNVPSLYASYSQYLGFSYVLSSQQEQGMEYFREASSAATPYRWNFQRDFGTEVAQVYFYYPKYITDQDVLDGVRAFEDARDAHPLDAYNHYALIDIYNEVSALDVKKYTALAEAEAKIALELSPNRQEVYFSLAKTKSIEGDNKAALAILKTALDLDPKIPDAHFYYGILAFAIGDGPTGYDIPLMKTGYDEIKAAIGLGRVWKTYYEPRAVGDYFADYSDATKTPAYLDEAIGLYREALILEQGDTETEIKLGVAYFRKGDFVDAKNSLEDAGKRFDFTKSASYVELKPILDQLGIK